MARPCILLVEDNPLNAELAATLLRDADFDVVEVSSGYQALSALDRQAIDLVLLDLHLPDLNGYEIAERIRRHPHHRDLKLIAFTAMALSGEADKASAAGCDAVLFKPIDVLTFADSVREHIDHPRPEGGQGPGGTEALVGQGSESSARILHDMRSSVAAFKSGVALLAEQLNAESATTAEVGGRLDPREILVQLQEAAERLQKHIKDIEPHLR